MKPAHLLFSTFVAVFMTGVRSMFGELSQNIIYVFNYIKTILMPGVYVNKLPAVLLIIMCLKLPSRPC